MGHAHVRQEATRDRATIRGEYDVAVRYFMVLELRDGALVDCDGTVKYHAAFGTD